jgi:hypothetical protein
VHLSHVRPEGREQEIHHARRLLTLLSDGRMINDA